MKLNSELLTVPKVIPIFPIITTQGITKQNKTTKKKKDYEYAPNTLENISFDKTISVYHSHRLPREVFYDSLSQISCYLHIISLITS